jgi:small subunit ribosomal protein S20
LPHNKSSKKRLLTSKRQRARNRSNRAELRTALRSFHAQQAAGDPEKQRQDLAALYSLLDVNARKGTIPKKRASRLKSRLALSLQKQTSAG